MSLPRYAPEREFPRYQFLPGRDPHPTRDPEGHSYTGVHEPPTEYFESERWRESVEYRFGADLYNHGYLWEAHEAWEGLWHPAKHDELQAEHLQGLIQCSAAALKVRMQQPRGLERLAEQGTARLEFVSKRTGGKFMGVELRLFVPALRAFASSAPTDADERPELTLDID